VAVGEQAILTIVEDDRVKLLLDYLRKLDEESPNLGSVPLHGILKI
jgi:hypothetical protein